jgi:hypothetical protein
MAGKIFINYRHGDDAGFTQALYKRLGERVRVRPPVHGCGRHIKPSDDFVAIQPLRTGESVGDRQLLLGEFSLRFRNDQRANQVDQ